MRQEFAKFPSGPRKRCHVCTASAISSTPCFPELLDGRGQVSDGGTLHGARVEAFSARVLPSEDFGVTPCLGYRSSKTQKCGWV